MGSRVLLSGLAPSVRVSPDGRRAAFPGRTGAGCESPLPPASWNFWADSPGRLLSVKPLLLTVLSSDAALFQGLCAPAVPSAWPARPPQVSDARSLSSFRRAALPPGPTPFPHALLGSPWWTQSTTGCPWGTGPSRAGTMLCCLQIRARQ